MVSGRKLCPDVAQGRSLFDIPCGFYTNWDKTEK